MLARICDICGKPECLKLIKEMAQKRSEGGEK